MVAAHIGTAARIGIVTVSDRASQGVYEDLGGPAIRDYLGKHITSEWADVSRIVPDETNVLSATLIELVDTEECSLIVTTGGTGPALRDITPEATAVSYTHLTLPTKRIV